MVAVKVGYPPKLVQEARADALVFPTLVANGDTITAEQSPDPLASSPSSVSSPPSTAPTPQQQTSDSTVQPAAGGDKRTQRPGIPRDGGAHCFVGWPSAMMMLMMAFGMAAPPRDPPPLNTEGVMIRRVIADDNSCLFNAVG